MKYKWNENLSVKENAELNKISYSTMFMHKKKHNLTAGRRFNNSKNASDNQTTTKVSNLKMSKVPNLSIAKASYEEQEYFYNKGWHSMWAFDGSCVYHKDQKTAELVSNR